MKITKTIGMLAVLFAVILSAQNASALYNSSLDQWEGNKAYTQDGFNMVLEWAVYTMAENPFSGISFPSGDQYIYAYQIINKTPSQDIGFFSILDLAGNPIPQSLIHNTQGVPIAQSIMPNPNPSETQGEWVWAEDSYVTQGNYSAYLIFSSPNAPTRGKFKILTPEELPPTPEVPEPGTITLFGVASCFLIMKYRRKLQTK
jgi:hypothetical protein